MEGHGCCKVESEVCFPGKPAPNFTAEAFHNGEVHKVSLSDYKGKWVVLFFYPKDFTFVCPTELGALADNYEKLQEMDVEVLSVSTDTAIVHKAWSDTSDTIKKIKFPMIADPTGRICWDYGTYIQEEGIALRGTFLIDPEGVLQTVEIHTDGIGRSVDELIRKIEAAKFVREHGDQACPANWTPGKETLTPGLDLVGKL